MAYKWDPREYSKSSAGQQKWAKELIYKLDLKGDERILDIGCGDGRITAEIAASVPTGCVVGVDNSREMIDYAKKKFPQQRFPNLSFEERDAANLEYDGEFDIVFSNAALHWVKDHLPVLKGIKNGLKPGGRMILQMGGRGNAKEILELLDDIVMTDEWKKYFTGFAFSYGFYGPEEYEKWLDQAGLEAKRVELIPKDMTHEGIDGLCAWIRTTWLPYVQRVPESVRDRFIDEIARKYIDNHPADQKGLVHVKMVRLEVEARKPR